MQNPRQRVLGKYELLHEINAGGNATVWKALYQEGASSEFVAVKVLHNRPGEDLVIQQMFDNEVRGLKMLQGSKNFARFIDAGYDKGLNQYCIIIEYFEKNFSQFLEENGPVSNLEEWKNSSEELINAVEIAHRRQIEHRDLKPANIMVRQISPESYELVLIDLGIARVPEFTEKNVTVREWHTPFYAPTNFDSFDEYARDVYALAAILLRMLISAEFTKAKNLHMWFKELKERQSIPEPIVNFLESAFYPSGQAVASIDAFRRSFHKALQDSSLSRAVRIPVFLNSLMWADFRSFDPELTGQELANMFRGDGVFALFKSVDGEIDQNVVYLIKNNYQISCKVKTHDSSTYLEAFAISELEEQLSEFKCSKGKEIDTLQFNIVFGTKLESMGKASIRDLLDFLKPESKIEIENPSLAEKIDLYRRMIDARKKAILGDEINIHFNGVEVRGKRCTFSFDGLKVYPEAQTYLEIKGLEKYSFEVIAVEEGYLELECTPVPTSLPDKGVLVRSLGPNKASFRRQIEALDKFSDSGLSVGLLPKVFEDPSSASSSELSDPLAFFGDLDEPKQEAVRIAMRSNDICLIQGPPGTGKTQFIVELVRQVVENSSNPVKILLVSQTHVAVDNALQRLRRSGFDSIIRVGRDEKISEESRDLVVDRQLAVWKESVESMAKMHMEMLATQASINVSDLEKACLLADLTDTLKPLPASPEVVKEELRTALSMELGQDQDDLEIFKQPQIELDEDAELLLRRLSKFGYRIEDLKAQVQKGKINELYQAELSKPGIAKLVRLYTIQRDWLRRFSFDLDLKQKVIRRTTLFAGTCVGFIGTPYLSDMEFDLCIIDEASKATATEMLVPLSRSKKAVLIGDSKQLPPNDEDLLRKVSILQEYNLTADDFGQTLFDELSDSLPDGSKTKLSIQYRMDQPIGSLISNSFYKGELLNGNQQPPDGLIKTMGKQVQWHDTSNLGDVRRETPYKHSYLNKLEIKLLLKFLRNLHKSIQSGEIKFPPGYLPSILVIAPYSKQVQEIRRELRINNLQARVETIDAVQGLEADFALISVTRSNTKKSFGFVGEDYWRRHNVALSRARHGLYIFGDAEFVISKKNGFRDALEHIVRHPESCATVKEGFKP